jgi:hypothetical protein
MQRFDPGDDARVFTFYNTRAEVDALIAGVRTAIGVSRERRPAQPYQDVIIEHTKRPRNFHARSRPEGRRLQPAVRRHRHRLRRSTATA